MKYEVRCACGKPRVVTGADAGATLRCACGRAVEVPSFHQLRTAGGEAATPLLVRVRTLIGSGALPGERVCAVCRRPTGGMARIGMGCEEESGGQPAYASKTGCLFFAVFGWLAPVAIATTSQVAKAESPDVSLVAPLPVCEACRPVLTQQAELRKALRQIPDYAAVLDQYPGTQLSLRGMSGGELKAVATPGPAEEERETYHPPVPASVGNRFRVGGEASAKYEARCACGKALAVTGADAGATLRCECGQSVDVPPLHHLRTAAGEVGTSPELVLWAMLTKGGWPDTKECAGCSRLTGGVVWAELIQYNPEEPNPTDIETAGCILALANVITNLILPSKPKRPAGYEVWTRIPVRCCEVCAGSMTNPNLRKALQQHPVTAGILAKYPELRVWRDK
jgi:hypothetical protein